MGFDVFITDVIQAEVFSFLCMIWKNVYECLYDKDFSMKYTSEVSWLSNVVPHVQAKGFTSV